MIATRSIYVMAVCLASAVALVAQERPIVMQVAVTDRYGRYIDGLNSTDFRVFEDGILQKISTFAERSARADSDGRKLGGTTYIITYSPDAINQNTGFREIRIELTRDEGNVWRVRHMPGYRPQR